MKFIRKRWHGIPIAIMLAVLVLALATSGVFAAYTFLSFTTVVAVDEPLYVEYNLNGQYGGDYDWYPLGDDDSLTIDGSAGDVFDIWLRINNRADSALTVATVITGDIAYFTFSGFPNGSVPASDGNDAVPEWQGLVRLAVNGDAPVGTSNLTFTFTRS